MLNSVAAEKENRTAEILLTSLRPRELMLGKVIGLGFIALLQMAIWMGGGMFALERGSQLVELAAGFSLPPGFAIWAFLFFVLGYFLYSSAMGAIGTLSPNAREGGQYTFLVILPLLLPLWFNVAFTESPNGLVATSLSLFPLTAPTSMLTRLAAIEVPLWQVLVSLGGLAITTYFFILLSSRFFRADTLLSSEALNWKRLGREIGRSLRK
jgi:ABC-2 type transport system permease protein